jgi:hypothetical protein
MQALLTVQPGIDDQVAFPAFYNIGIQGSEWILRERDLQLI